MRLRSAALVALALLLPFPASSAPGGAGNHRIPATGQPMKIDGTPDEPAWENAWRTDLAWEVDPGENLPAPVRTEVRVLTGPTDLYIAFIAHDPDPDAIRAHLTDRDHAWADDWVGVILDTFNDQRRNYLFVVNPLGVQMDNIETWPDGEGTVWDGIWDSAARIEEWGWSAEIRIPFSSLRFQRFAGTQVWGFDAIRAYPRDVFRKMGTFPRDRNNNCYLCQAIKIEGFEGVSPGRNLEIVPIVVGGRTEERSDPSTGVYDISNDDLEPGVTARWGMTPNLTLGGTLNPDFSQVEADALQLDINEPFALFFPEKRPFFMEGADIFDSPLDAVYTRTVRDPSWGLKLTGKEGANTIGVYTVQDDVTNILLPGVFSSGGVSLDMHNTSAVLRYKRDFGNRHTVGALATGREGDDYHNRTYGVDGDFRLSDRDRVVFQVMRSSTRDPWSPDETRNDTAYDLSYSHATRTFSLWGNLHDIGREFRADLGFLPRNGFRHAEAGGQYLWTGGESDWYSKLLLIAKVADTEDQDGRLLKREYAVRFNYEGPLQSHLFIRPSRVREGFELTDTATGYRVHDLDEIFLHSCFKPNGDSHFWMNLITGDRIDYATNEPGERFHTQTGFWYRVGRHLLIEPQVIYERLEVDSAWRYTARFSQVTTAWQFNARTFLRAIVQHSDFRREDSPKDESLFTQFLFSYKINPRTVFFLGYSDNWAGNEDLDLTRADRTVFAKLGYAWVM